MAKYYDAETGEQLPDDQVANAFASGRLAVDASDAPVVVRDANGNRLQVDGDGMASRLGDYLTNGYTIESDAQRADTEMRLEAGAQPFQAAGEALARGATLGLSDVAGAAVLGDEYAQRANVRRQSLEGIGTGLEIAGGIAPALATGGTSLGAKALASTPAGLLARGTGALGASLERSMLARGASQGAARFAGMLAEGGVDGALSGVGSALSESSLGNTEVTAENLLASGGLGALFGAGAGGLFGAATSGASRGARGLADSLRKRTTGETVERGAREAGGFRYVPDAVIDQMVDKGSSALGIDQDVLRSGFDSPSIRADIINSQAVKDGFNKRIREDLQGMLDDAVHTRSVFAGGIKRANLEKEIPNDPSKYGEVMRAANEAVSPYVRRLDDMKARGLIKPKDYQRLRADAQHVLDSLDTHIGSGAGGESTGAFNRETGEALQKKQGSLSKAFLALESLKRSADDSRKTFKGRGGSLAEREGFPLLQQGYADLGDSVRNLLEREDLFGAAGTKQAARNAAGAKSFQTADAFRERFVRGTGESLDPAHWEIEKDIIDGDKADAFINNLLNPNRDYTNDQIKRHLADVADRYDVFLNQDDVPNELIEQFRKSR